MKKVTYYFRDPRPGNFSIEELFKNIRLSLPKDIEGKDYFHNTKYSRLKNILIARKHQGEVNHITGDVNFLAIGLDRRKTILTIHDLGHIENTLTGIKALIYKLIWYKLPIYKSTYITTISEFTKATLLKHFKVNKEKIKVIYNPCPKNFYYSPKIFNKECPTILQIGSGETKNIKGLIEAVKGMNVKLLLIRKFDETIQNDLIKHNIKHEWKYKLTSDEIFNCYQECDIVYFASFYEGFGMPIVESNAIGRVIITSNTSSMPEIANDAAIIVDPKNVKEIRDAIVNLCSNDNLREKLITKGLVNIERFKPEKIARAYSELYRLIAK